jgi:hypothetical protein
MAPLLPARLAGHCSLPSLVVWWPYHLGLRLKLYIQRRVSTEPLYDKILPGLYLGGWPESAGKLPKVAKVGQGGTGTQPRA